MLGQILFLSDFNFATFCTCPFFLFCSLFFPKNIDDLFFHTLPNSMNFIYLEPVLELSSFEIKPNNQMKLIPFLFPRDKYCWFYLLFLLFEFIFFLGFKLILEIGFKNNTKYFL